MIVMFAGAIIAASNLITNIVPWLETIGILVPLVGGILIGHFWIVARKNTIEEHLVAADKKFNVPAMIGLASGLLIAVVIRIVAPDLPPVIGGLIGGIVIYPAVAKLKGYFRNGQLTEKALGDKIINDATKTIDGSANPTNVKEIDGQSKFDQEIHFNDESDSNKKISDRRDQ